MKTKVDALRESITSVQRTILNEIWHHYREHNEWMSSKRLHNTFGKQTVLEALCPLGASVVCEMDGRSQGGNYYELRLLGILLTDQSTDVETLLVRYLTFLRDRFQADPDFKEATSSQVQTALELSPQQSQLLYGLLIMGNLIGGSASYSTEGWRAGPISDVDDLPSIPDLRSYLHTFALRGYDPACPVLVDDRIRYMYGNPQQLAAVFHSYENGESGVNIQPHVEAPHIIESTPDSLSKAWFVRVWHSRFRWVYLSLAAFIVILFALWASLPEEAKMQAIKWIVQHAER